MTVVAFKDCVPLGQPDPELIERIESILEEAKSGELRGIAYALVRTDGGQGVGWTGVDGTRHLLASGIMMLHHNYAARMQE